MKLVQITFHFEYTEIIEALLDRHGIEHYVRVPMIEGKDREGKHFGSQVHPGNVTVVMAQVESDRIALLFDDLRAFRDRKPSHRHLSAIVLPIEQTL